MLIMRILVTGSAGHLGEGLIRHLDHSGHEPVGVDINTSQFTTLSGTVTDLDFVDSCMQDVDAVIHAATLHKPHVGKHSRQAFVDTNISGTLNLLEAAVRHQVGAFVYTSTTSAFGDAMRPAQGDPAVWVTEAIRSQPRNIYGVTKLAAEHLCQMFHRNMALPCVVLRTSRFFPEDDDNRHKRDAFDDDNLKLNELLFRRADLHDMVTAHVSAVAKAPEIGFGKFIISATSPFGHEDAAALAVDTPLGRGAVCARFRPSCIKSTVGRCSKRSAASMTIAWPVEILGWSPEFSFAQAISDLLEGRDYRSKLSTQVGKKGYHDQVFEDGPYPVEETPDIERGHDR